MTDTTGTTDTEWILDAWPSCGKGLRCWTSWQRWKAKAEERNPGVHATHKDICRASMALDVFVAVTNKDKATRRLTIRTTSKDRRITASRNRRRSARNCGCCVCSY
jgi:hypothetical protein